MEIQLAKIKIDGGTQSRVGLNNDVCHEYAIKVQEGEVFPPVTVFFDGSDYWLADGFHRFLAHQQAGKTEINADIKNGSKRDAVLYSLTEANRSHGLRLSNEDKRKRVEALLNDAEWSKWSDREIARKAGVSHQTVSNYRQPICQNLTDTPVRTVERNGTVYEQNTANIGKTEEIKQEVPQTNVQPVMPVPPEHQRVPEDLPSEAEEQAPEVISKDVYDLLDEMKNDLDSKDREIAGLEKQIESLLVSDKEKEINKLSTQLAQYKQLLIHEQTKAQRQEKELRYFGRLLETLRKWTGVDSNPKLNEWVKARANPQATAIKGVVNE